MEPPARPPDDRCMPPALRLFVGPDAPLSPAPEPAVTVRLGDLLGATDAAAGRAWISDFADDPVRVTADLAEVLHAARAMRETDGRNSERRAA